MLKVLVCKKKTNRDHLYSATLSISFETIQFIMTFFSKTFGSKPKGQSTSASAPPLKDLDPPSYEKAIGIQTTYAIRYSLTMEYNGQVSGEDLMDSLIEIAWHYKGSAKMAPIFKEVLILSVLQFGKEKKAAVSSINKIALIDLGPRKWPARKMSTWEDIQIKCVVPVGNASARVKFSLNLYHPDEEHRNLQGSTIVALIHKAAEKDRFTVLRMYSSLGMSIPDGSEIK